MKKFFYRFLIFVIVLIVAIVVAANSSYVIKKAADVFAPDYHISYDDITGNVFTGVNITGLKFDNQEMSKNIRFSWNPSKILYKRVAINEISVEDLDVDVAKALIASFPKSVEDNSSSDPLPVVITVDKAHLTVKPFEEQGIAFHKTEADVKDVTYASDALDIEHLALQLDTNMAKVLLEASLENGKLQIEQLSAKDVDSVSLEKIILTKDKNSTKIETDKTAKNEKKEALNPLIPKEVELKHLLASIKSRSYKTVKIDTLQISAKDLKADISKIVSNSANSLNIGNFDLLFESNIGNVDFVGSLEQESVIFDQINLKDIGIFAIQKLVASDNNSSEANSSSPIADNSTAKETKEKNNLIPHYLLIKQLHADLRETAYYPEQIVDRIHEDLRPDVYDPVKLHSMILNVKDFQFNIKKLIAEKGNVELNGTSSFIDFTHSGKIKDNHLSGDIVLIPQDELFKFYNLPIREEAIDDIAINFKASPKKVVADLNTKAKQILMTQKSDLNTSKAFNLDLDSLKSHVVYMVKKNSLTADTNIMISTPYAKDISVTNRFKMDENVTYQGEVNLKEIIGIDKNLTTPLENLKIAYRGNTHRVKTDISSNALKGNFISSDMKTGKFHLETIEALAIDKMVALPGELNGTKVNAVIDVPIDLRKITPLNAKAKLTSNVVNVDADIMYGKQVKVVAKSVIPKDSLLINFDKNIHFSAISPMITTIEMKKKDLTLTAKSSKISADVLMKPDEKTIDGKINLAGLAATLDAKPNGDIAIQSNVGSFATLLTSIQQFYTVEDMPKVDGKLDISMLVRKNKDITLTMASPKVIYHADRKTDHDINDLKIVLAKQGDKILLNNYTLSYNKMKVFATKPSEVNFKKGNLVINQFWLNDQLKVTGQLDTKTMKGQILADAATFHLAHEMIDLDSAINIKTVVDGNSTDIKGKVTLLGGDIHYDLTKKTFPSDSDIVIVQEMKKKKENPFMDHLTIAVNVDTKKPLVYKKGSINVQAKVQMDIHKAIYSDPMVIGSLDLVDGGYYMFREKKFVLENSHVYFTGDPEKPMLDLTVKYKTIKNTLITINITGTPAVPNILFSSVPSLSKEQILSVILFDSEEGAGTNSGDDMMKMMGGAMAKSALSNLGVKLDHLVIGEGNSVEVGKKISDKTTVIYINGDIPEMKLKYDYSPSVVGVIGTTERSESVDVVYKKDFSADDIVIKGR